MNLKVIKKIIITSFLLGLTSCTGSDQPATPAPAPVTKNIEVKVLGLSKFGSVVVGDYRQTKVQITNNTNAFAPILPSISAPFFITEVKEPCDSGMIPPGETCFFSVKFEPHTFGNFTATLNLGESSVVFSGKGLIGGDIGVSELNVDLGSIPAGEEVVKSLLLTNTGDFTVVFPEFSSHPEIKLISNYCGSYLDPKKTCEIRFRIIKRTLGPQNDVIAMTSTSRGSGTNTVPIGFTSTVSPGSPSGNIGFGGSPPILVADGEQISEITTDTIKDEFGNAVINGTAIKVQVQNLILAESTNTFITVNGKISFKIKTTTSKGGASVSVYSGTAYGVLPLYVRAGKPYGLLSVLPYNQNLVADGTTQLGLRLNTIYDKFNNVVEDGTEIQISVTGGGTASSNNIIFSPSIVATTFMGSAQFTIKSSRTSGDAKIEARANPIYDGSNNIVNHYAKGDFHLSFIPGDASGLIPVASQKNGINAIEDMTLITIGPVRDLTGNVVKQNTPIDIQITNGLNVSGTGKVLFTNEQGKVSFILQGSGNRGPIKIKASTIKAQGEKVVWAYKDSHLTLQGQKRDDWNMGEGDNNINSGRAYIRYYKAVSNPELFPSINEVWDEIFDYNKISHTDRVYYSIEKINGNPQSTLGKAPGYTFPLRIPVTDLLPKSINYSGPNAEGLPLFKSAVFYSAGEKLLNSPFWSTSIPTPGSNLFGCGSENSNYLSQYRYNVMMFTPSNGKYSCDYDGSVVTTNSPADRTTIASRENLYWPSVGYVEDPIGCSFDSAQSPVFSFKLGEFLRGEDSTRTIKITNPNPTEISNLSFYFNQGSDLRWELNNIDCGSSLESQASCLITVRFNSNSQTVPAEYSAALKASSNAVISDVLLSVKIKESGSAPPPESSAVGIIVMKTNCYSKLVSFGGYNYIWNENQTQTVANTSKVTSVFNVRGQLISKFDNECANFETQESCSLGNGCTWRRDPDAASDAPLRCENSINLGSYPSRGKGFSPFVSVGKKLYQFSGFDPSGDGDVSTDGLLEFDTESGKWRSLSPNPDPDADPSNPTNGEPAARYQHGMVYVPETKSLYLYGGMSTSLEPGKFGDPAPLNDLWQLNLFPDPVLNLASGELEPQDLKWKRICKECIPVSTASIFKQILRDSSNPGPGFTSDPGVSYLTWNRAHKKVFMYWLGKPYAYWFDPTVSPIKFEPVDSSSGAVFLGSSYQVLYNQRQGRMYSYSHGNPGGNPYIPPSFKVWDMDANQKTYFRTRFNLGDGAKEWAKVLTPRVKSYGAAGPDSSCGDPCPGVLAYLFNHDKGTWSFIGENTSISDESLKTQGEISFSWADSDAREHVSSDGFVDIIVVPKGSPSEYNQINIDSIYLDGTF